MGTYPVAGADAATFRPLGGLFGADKLHVYFAEKLVETADPKTFTVIDATTGRDATAIFRAYNKCNDCDLKTFRRLDDSWYVDKDAAYAAMNDGWVRVPDVDTKSFKPINSWFAKDNKNVFLHRTRIIGADAASFKLESCGVCEVCGEDKNRCYSYDHAVPCDCKARNGSAFPKSMYDIQPGHSLIDAAHRGEIEVEKVDDNDVVAKKFPPVEPGSHRLDVICHSRPNITAKGQLIVDIRPNRIYRLRPLDAAKCSLTLDTLTWLRGRIESPEISIQVPDSNDWKGFKWALEMEMQPGANTFTAVCREVTRSRIREGRAAQSVTLLEGHLYRLDGGFLGNSDVCRVRIIDQGIS
jgi:hypothetical protein